MRKKSQIVITPVREKKMIWKEKRIFYSKKKSVKQHKRIFMEKSKEKKPVRNGMGNGTSDMHESNDFRIGDLIQFKRSNDTKKISWCCCCCCWLKNSFVAKPTQKWIGQNEFAAKQWPRSARHICNLSIRFPFSISFLTFFLVDYIATPICVCVCVFFPYGVEKQRETRKPWNKQQNKTDKKKINGKIRR